MIHLKCQAQRRHAVHVAILFLTLGWACSPVLSSTSPMPADLASLRGHRLVSLLQVTARLDLGLTARFLPPTPPTRPAFPVLPGAQNDFNSLGLEHNKIMLEKVKKPISKLFLKMFFCPWGSPCCHSADGTVDLQMAIFSLRADHLGCILLILFGDLTNGWDMLVLVLLVLLLFTSCLFVGSRSRAGAPFTPISLF